MIIKISHFTLFVKNQDDALKFYTEKLGFKKHTDASFEGMRWLTVCPAAQPDFEIALMPASPEEVVLVGLQAGRHPLFAMETSDCQADYEAFSKAGVEFASAPKSEPWGISAAFKDLYGNIIYMAQPTKPS